jgi:hypothetical protein
MLFNSFAFFLFFPLVTVCFFLLPHRCRWGLLLGASCLFYMYFNFISDNLRLLAGLIQELKGRGIAVVLVTLPVSRYYADGMDRARSEPGIAAIAANGSR